MKRKRFNEEQIIAVLKEHKAGARVPDQSCRDDLRHTQTEQEQPSPLRYDLDRQRFVTSAPQESHRLLVPRLRTHGANALA